MTIFKHIVIVEDGDEYEQFARLFLGDQCRISAAHSAAEALRLLQDDPADGFLIDLRFDRAPESALAGDVGETARRLFSGDRDAAVRYLQDQQGTLVLGELRRAGHHGPALFVHDFAPRKLENLRRLYGEVLAVCSFDARLIREALGLDG